MNTTTKTMSVIGGDSRVMRLENFSTRRDDRYVFCHYTALNGICHIIPLFLSGNRALVFPSVGELFKSFGKVLFAVAGFIDQFDFCFLESADDTQNEHQEFARGSASLINLLDGINLSDPDDSESDATDTDKNRVDRFAFIERTSSLHDKGYFDFGIYQSPRGVERAVAIYSSFHGYVDIYASLEDACNYFSSGILGNKRLHSVSSDFFENRMNSEGVPYETNQGKPVPSSEPHFERWLVARLDDEITEENQLTLNQREEKALC